MKATLTVNKAELREKLVNQLEANQKNGRYREYIQEIEEALELLKNGETPEAYKARLVTYHRYIAKGIEDGEIGVTASGKLSGNVPTKPVKNHGNSFARWNKDQLKNQLKQYRAYAERDLKPIRAAIELLDMATGNTIQIDSADYHNLLS